MFNMYVHKHINIHTEMYIHIYIYISMYTDMYLEREGERERERFGSKYCTHDGYSDLSSCLGTWTRRFVQFTAGHLESL